MFGNYLHSFQALGMTVLGEFVFVIKDAYIDFGCLLDSPRGAVLICIHNLCFSAEISKAMTTLANPTFVY